MSNRFGWKCKENSHRGKYWRIEQNIGIKFVFTLANVEKTKLERSVNQSLWWVVLWSLAQSDFNLTSVWEFPTWGRELMIHWLEQEAVTEASPNAPRTLPRCSPAAPNYYSPQSPRSAPPLHRWPLPGSYCGGQSSRRTWRICKIVLPTDKGTKKERWHSKNCLNHITNLVIEHLTFRTKAQEI